MIREYDQMHSTLALLVSELRGEQSQGICREDEEFLLNKISELEIEKNKKEENLKKIELENSNLQIRLESLNELKNEFETKCRAISDAQTAKFESLSGEHSSLKARLAESQQTVKRLRQDNESAYEALRQLELEKSQLKLETSQQFDKSSLKNSQLEKMLTKQKALTKHVESGLGRKTIEVEQLMTKVDDCHRKYDAVLQLNKSNEASLRALRNENKDLSEQLESLNGSYHKMKDGFRKVAIELKSDTHDEGVIEETIQAFFDIREIELVCNESLSEDELEVNRSLEELEREFQDQDMHFDADKIESMEIELNEISNIDSVELDKLVRFLPNLNGSGSPKRQEITSSRTHKISNIDEVFGNERGADSPRLDREKIQSQIEEQIESNIQRRSIKKSKTFRFGLDDKLFESGKTLVKPEQADLDLERLLGELKALAEKRIDAMGRDVLSEGEKGEIRGALEATENVKEFVLWTFKLFEEKLSLRTSRLESVRSEKEGVESAMREKSEQLERLQKEFIRRNKDYEALLNETIRVNSQIFKNRQKKKKERRHKNESKRSSQSKKEESGFFSFITKSFLPETVSKKSHKSASVKSTKKAKASFVISKDFAKKNLAPRFADDSGSVGGSAKTERDPLKNLKFVEDMANIQEDLGPSPVFEYNGDVSSLRDILQKTQLTRSANLREFLSGKPSERLETVEEVEVAPAPQADSAESKRSVEDFLRKKKVEISKRKKNKYFFKKLNKMFG